MIETIIEGMMNNWMIVGFSFFALVFGTWAAYRKHGLKRVLLGKTNDDRELIYKKENGDIIWGKTLKSWKIIVMGGMSLLTVFLLIMVLVLSFVYGMDMRATRVNDEIFCREFGTVNPTETELENYYAEERSEQVVGYVKQEFIGPMQLK